MIEFNGDVIFLDGSGQVRAKNGSLTLRGDDTGTKEIIVGSGASLRPDKKLAIDLGTSNLEWHRLFAGRANIFSGVIGGADFEIVPGFFRFNNTTVTFDGISVLFDLSTSVSFNSTTSVSLAGSTSVFGTFTLATNIDPNIDGVRSIGNLGSRLRQVNAASGLFNVITPPTSGSFIIVNGSLVPNRNATHALGTNALRWGNIYGTSGTFDNLISNSLISDTIDLGSSMTMEDASNITLNGNISWKGNSFQVDVGSTIKWNFNDDCLVNFNNRRPLVNTSGVALAEENYFEVYAGRSVDFGATVANDILEPDTGGAAIANGDDYFIVNRSVKLISFATNTQHLNGSQPAAWTIRMRLNGSTTDWASGKISFASTNTTNFTTVGSWSGNTHVPSGSRCQVRIDNNGGATVNIVFCKAWVGFAVSGVP